MTADDLSALNDQIAAMARAGLPLDQGLESLAKDMGRGQLKSVTVALVNDLRAGHPLAEALALQEGKIPPYYANLVTAGVQTGRLPQVLTTLTSYARTVASTRTTVIDALFYPILVLIVGVALFSLIGGFFLPQVVEIFNDFGMSLPFVTRMVLAVGAYPVEIILIPLSTLAALGVATAILVQFTAGGRRIWSRSVYFIPLVGRLIRSARLAALTDLLAMLVEYGVPLPKAFRLAGAASSDPNMVDHAREVEVKLNAGAPLAEALRDVQLVPQWVGWLAAAGERQNALASSLREIASLYRRQVETQSSVLRNVLPSFVVIATAGLLTGLFVMAVMLPFIKLIEGLSK